MKDIKVLGSGCKKCKVTSVRIAERSEALGIRVELSKVEDFAQIAQYGVMGTPSVVIDGRVVHTGSVPSVAMIDGWLQEA